MRAIWTESKPSYRGRFVSFAGVQAHPQPVQRPLPIVIGGRTPPAFRRAVQAGNGWYGFALDLEATRRAIDGLRAAAQSTPRPSELGTLDLSITPGRGVSVDTAVCERYAALGVDRLILMPPPKRVGILVFPDVEVLDFCGPFEVFSVTRLGEYRREEPSPFEVMLVAERAGPLTATGGLKILPDHTLEACPPLDILLVPGGWGTRAELANALLIGWIRERAGHAETLTSVCTGPLLLGQAGLLDGRRATTHWLALELMRKLF